MRKLLSLTILAAAAVALGGCAHSVATVCTSKFGYAVGTIPYAKCFNQLTAEREATAARIAARTKAINEAIVGVGLVGIAAYGESRSQSSEIPQSTYSAPSIRGATYRLVNQWVASGQRFCSYSNGSVLNLGVSLCPYSITG